MQVIARERLPADGAQWGKLVLIWIGLATAAVGCVLVAFILTITNPSHRGATQSAPQVTTD